MNDNEHKKNTETAAHNYETDDDDHYYEILTKRCNNCVLHDYDDAYEYNRYCNALIG